MMLRAEVSGWGRWPLAYCTTVAPGAVEDVAPALATLPSAIAHGLGRSYGDSALNPGGVVHMRGLNRMVAFDADQGLLTAEAGVSLAEIIAAFLPQGFFPIVTPGTRFVTLGGAIASDVHGKNHHCDGSFGHHVTGIELLLPDGRTVTCGPDREPDLFRATLGGMGLTGIILRATIRLRRVETGWIRQRTIVAADLDAAMAAFEANQNVPYSVAWIDCLATGPARGRSLVYLGSHAALSDLPRDLARDPLHPKPRPVRSVPFDFPGFALNRLSVRAFNAAYFRAGSRKPGDQLVDWDSYFYPLDAIRNWNRIYGARGFAQYQCALPLATSRSALLALLEAIAETGLGSFLAVLKRLGPGAPDRPLSFPIEGYTLALDFPRSDKALALMDRLDRITVAAGGRLYLAKDSRMTAATFRAGYGDAPAATLAALRKTLPDHPRMVSVQSQRLGL